MIFIVFSEEDLHDDDDNGYNNNNDKDSRNDERAFCASLKKVKNV